MFSILPEMQETSTRDLFLLLCPLLRARELQALNPHRLVFETHRCREISHQPHLALDASSVEWEASLENIFKRLAHNKLSINSNQYSVHYRYYGLTPEWM